MSLLSVLGGIFGPTWGAPGFEKTPYTNVDFKRAQPNEVEKLETVGPPGS